MNHYYCPLYKRTQPLRPCKLIGNGKRGHRLIRPAGWAIGHIEIHHTQLFKLSQVEFKKKRAGNSVKLKGQQND